MGLLRLHREPHRPGSYVRIFNAFKSAEVDRMIGDRRKVNYMERHLAGSSRFLPAGPMLTGLHLSPGQCLRGSVTDRRDFYHQCAATWERSASQLLPFSFPTSWFDGMDAYEDFKAREQQVSSTRREVVGDRLGFEKAAKKKAEPERLFPAFSALYQGDHLGVEFALGAHEGLLESEGLLQKDERIVGRSSLPWGPVWRGLIIDDFFTITAESEEIPTERTEAFRILDCARRAYEKHKLPGSPEKDVVASRLFKVAGAEIDSRKEVTRRRMTLVGAPLAKRIGLATLSLRIAAMPGITPALAARLSGGWVSVLLYRRCFSSIVEDLFGVGSFTTDAEARSLRRLSRKISEELSLLAVLSPLMVSNVMAEHSQKLYATDASMQKGAVVSTRVPEEISRILWNGGDRKGNYTMLDNPFRALRLHLGEEVHEELPSPIAVVDPEHERPFYFDFVEVFGGVGAVSEAIGSLGAVVAPVLDLSWSRQYDFQNVRLLEWLLFMLEEKRILGVLLAPPCTSFSPAAHPAVRSYKQPRGFDRSHPKVLLGNHMAFKSIIIMKFVKEKLLVGILEQPRLSKMAWLSGWRWLVQLGCSEAVVAECQFDSPHRKEFRLLCTGVDAGSIDTRCKGGHVHIPIAGKYTKPSAIYTPAFAMHLAKHLWKGIQLVKLREYDPSDSGGFESALVNDILLSCRWEEHRDWHWKHRAHINVLETMAVTSLFKEAIVGKAEDVRLNVLVDSAVAKGALAKGRSSSFSLQPTLRRTATYLVAGGIFPSISFAPTRWNPADAPTREKPMPSPVPCSLTDLVDSSTLISLHSVSLSRPFSNWVRLSLLILLLTSAPAPVEASAPADLDFALQSPAFSFFGFCQIGVLTFTLDLIATHLLQGLRLCVHYLIPCAVILPTVLLRCKGHSRKRGWFIVALIFLSSLDCAFAPMAPVTHADEARAAMRSGITLASDRLVRKQTRENRHQLLSAFEHWLWEEHGVSWLEILERKPLDAEEISNWLSLYGRDLHASGRSYGKYSETINAVAMIRPILKRQLGGAWDIASSWLLDEPYEHHPAMPASILISLVTIGLLWGWPRESAILCLGWAGLLRVGEILNAKRSDLVLPEESAPGIDYILLRLEEPKTRGRSARHQAARIEPRDLVLLISAVFYSLSPTEKLWKMSSATLRKRFSQLLGGLGILPRKAQGHEFGWKQELPLGQLQSQAFLYTWLKQIPSGLTLVLTLSGKLSRHEGSILHLIPPLFTVPSLFLHVHLRSGV